MSCIPKVRPSLNGGGAFETTTEGNWAHSLTLRMVRGLRVQAEGWFETCQSLSRWEEAKLVDHPDDKLLLLTHGAMLTELEMLGRWLLWPMKDKNWPDTQLRGLVESNLRNLNDRRAMWHGAGLTKSESDTIVKDGVW